MKRWIEIGPDTKIARLGGRPPRVVLVFLALGMGLFLLYAFAEGPPWVASYFGASARTTLGQLRLWQPFSALLIHLDSRGLLFNMLGLWIFGSALERFWGSRWFALFFVVTGLVGLWAGVLVGQLRPDVVLHGPGGATVAMMLATAVLFTDHLVFFFGLIPVKTKIFALALAGFVLAGNLLAGYYLEAVIEVAGAIAALPFLFPPRRLISRGQKPSRRRLGLVQGGKDPRYLN